MGRIRFLPLKKEIENGGGRNILQLATEAGVYIQSICGGKKKCGKCKVIIEEIEQSLAPPSDFEQDILGPGHIDKGYRLACCTVLTGGAVIRIPEESQARRQVILTSGTSYAYPAKLQPVLDQYLVEVQTPTIQSVRADLERLYMSIEDDFGLKHLTIDPIALRKLPFSLRSYEKGLVATIWDKQEIIDLQKEAQGPLMGMAFDIGTTTVVGYLMDLLAGKRLSVKSAMNPQIPFGDDVITRISFCQEDPHGQKKLRSAIVQCLNTLILEASQEAGIDPCQIMELTVVGNTAMHHLLLGLDPKYLAISPFPPVMTNAMDLKARDLNIRIGPSANVHLLPLKAGFVGSDAIACVLASRMHLSKTETLLVDLGTNGEILLGNRNRMVCCSTAAGPAFEGGHISWGMRAASGAIEKVDIDPETLDVQMKTIHESGPVGICGSGLISAVAEMIRAGIILHRGNFNDKITSDRLREGKQGFEFVLSWAEENPTAHDIVITQKDVSELQMAKAAIQAGATLLKEVLTRDPQRVFLAGAGGNFIDPADACTIGLFPTSTNTDIIGIGNGAGQGACLALLDKRKRRDAQRIAEKMEYIELSASDKFQELFVSSMFFPTAVDFSDIF